MASAPADNAAPEVVPEKAVPEPSPVKREAARAANEAVLAAIEAAVDAVAVGYQWEQTPEGLTLVFSVPKATQLVDVQVSVTSTEIKAGIEGHPLRIAGTLHQEIDPEASSWQLESKKESKGSRTFVQIMLEKRVPMEWEFPFKHGTNNEQ